MSGSPLLEDCRALLDQLGRANRSFQDTYPGDRPTRQPVHTVYGGAQLYRAETTSKLGQLALRAMDTYGPDAFTFAEAVGLADLAHLSEGERADLAATYERDPSAVQDADASAWLALAVHQRVQNKLRTEAVEDFRIDFEDGFGARSDEEEDATAQRAAGELARAMREGLAPPFSGIRIKSLSEEWKERAVRTLDVFIGTLLSESGGVMPANFVVTLPKVTLREQVSTLVRVLEKLEARHGLAAGTLQLEFMIEVTQALIARDGRSPLPGFLEAAEGRCRGIHFGTYDYTASCNITAAYQVMDHPMCDLAKGMMLLAYGGTGALLSDGATNVMPVGPHKATAGKPLTQAQEAENRRVVHSAWQLSASHIRHSLEGGYYQGWDLHPGQLPVRYATCYGFFLEGFAKAAERLRNFIEKAAQATLVGDVFDDAATGQGLLNYFLRALNCGAITMDDLAVTGLTREEVQLRSFAKILAARKARLKD